MKVLLENPVEFTNMKNFTEALTEYAEILQDVTCAKNEEELRRNMKSEKRINFLYGFGSSHLWVKQIYPKTNLPLKNRIIFAEF